MSFFREVALALGAGEVVSGGYSIIGYGGEALYIEGVKRILSLDSAKMRFDCGKKIVCVIGENLNVCELGGGCVGIKGRIAAFEEEGA